MKIAVIFVIAIQSRQILEAVADKVASTRGAALRLILPLF